MSRKGMINKYIGDAVMAIWGVPLPNPDHAVLACAAALDMQHRIEKMPRLDSRIGLNTGEMVAGNLGHRERMEYTVIGDAVNLASRLEGANKPFGTPIMISDSTEELVRGHFVTRQLDAIRVMGKKQPVKVYELMAEVDSELVTAELKSMLESYAEFLECYTSRDWERACKLADRHAVNFAKDTVITKIYQPRCRLFLKEPPEPDWDGVFDLKSK